MESRGRFVQQVESPPRRTTRKLARQFDSLRLAAGKRSGALAKRNIAKPHVGESRQLSRQRRHLAKELSGLRNGHRQHIADVFSAVGNLERLSVEALAAALLAGDINIGQEAHFQPARAIPPAYLAASALDIERKASGIVAAHFGRGGLGEELADFSEKPHISCRIRTRRAADWRLVDFDNLVELVIPGKPTEFPGCFLGAIEPAHQFALERLVDERGLARAGNAGDDCERADWKARGYILEIVFPAAGDDEKIVAAACSWRRRGRGDFLSS